ncbi:MAG: hypothetical protein HBSAPP03_13000 [Phycisphaerae bacterium]|nr:MAG: hypothetical protein HBSAPP03_13000 [Phycisphaerae bacterium]
MAKQTPNMKRFATADQLGVVPGVVPPAGCTAVPSRVTSAEDELLAMIDDPEIRAELAQSLDTANSMDDTACPMGNAGT